MQQAEILIVDDEEDIRGLVRDILEDEGYATRCAAGAEDAYRIIKESIPDLVILDIWLQGSADDGMQVLTRIRKSNPYLPVLMISGHGTIETAVSAIKKGAYDFIEKPFKADRLLLMIQRALENASLRKENETLKKSISGPSGKMIGESQAIRNIHGVLDKVAPTNSRVLLTGEAGTGKNLAARYIHCHSKRADAPFMTLNCTTLNPERLEAELFGSVEGVFGEPSKTGLLELAKGGTLLLDEVADLPVETQGRIVRMFQENTARNVGGGRPYEVDVRIVATTTQDIASFIEDGRFRSDLYYRLNVVPIHMPPLRERPGDIPLLAEAMMKEIAAEQGVRVFPFSASAMMALQTYSWPGNIRQLRNVLEWVAIMGPVAPDGAYHVDHLPPEIIGRDAAARDYGGAGALDFIGLTLREAREKFETDYLRAQVERFQGNISKTAQFVGMERSALHRKLKSLDIAANEKDHVAPEQNNRRKTAAG